MTCYHPLKGFAVDLTVNNRPDYKIVSYDTHHLEYYGGHWHNCSTDYVSSMAEQVLYDYIEIPCGRCIGCRLAYSRQWADRCMLEMREHESTYFVTLTYDDDHLPTVDHLAADTGEIVKIPTLVKRDFQLFMKRLRKNYKYDNKLRYYMAGEYGGQTARPHYHAIIFGLKLDDLVLYTAGQGYVYYNSMFLSDCWQHKGHVVVAKACWETCAYTARYIMKKQYGDAASVYDEYGIQPEFTLMSRRPGIARDYFDDHGPAIWDTDCIYVPTESGAKEMKPPRYYKKMLAIIDPIRYTEISDKSIADRAYGTAYKLLHTSESYLDMLATEESAKIAQTNILRRS